MNDFIFITESVRGGISESGFYHFFDNATISVSIGVLIASIIAIWQYREQKKLDYLENRKLEVINKFFILKSKINLFVPNVEGFKIALKNYALGKAGKFKEKIEENNFETMKKINNNLNEMAELEREIRNFIKLYFGHQEIFNKYVDFNRIFLEWRDFMDENIFSDINVTKIKTENLELCIDNIVFMIEKTKGFKSYLDK